MSDNNNAKQDGSPKLDCEEPSTESSSEVVGEVISTANESSQPVSASYEAFDGDFLAEDFVHRAAKHLEKNDEECSTDDDSTSDDVTTICEEEVNLTADLQVESVDVPPLQLEKSRSLSPSHMFSKKIHGTPALGETTLTREISRRPKSAANQRTRHKSSEQPKFDQVHGDGQMEGAFKSSELRAVLTEYKKSSLKRYNSTGDLRTTGRMSPATRKRLLPDLAACRRLSHDEDFDSASSSEDRPNDPDTPGDRKTLEAQFKLLYRENVKLDKAYGELQDKIRQESPRILSARYVSPREGEWQNEKKQLKKEIKELQEKVTQLKTSQALESGGSSPSSERTEKSWAEKIKTLNNVKDAEIARLTEQLSYWRQQTVKSPFAEKTNERQEGDIKNDRIAELELSEAQLRCQVINLEDQLGDAKTKLQCSNIQNKDLAEHARKLEDSLDAEKSMLDELKMQNSKLRSNLASAEADANQLVDKIANMADENARLQVQISEASKFDKTPTLEENLKELTLEVTALKNERSDLKERCSALGDVKSCLTEQVRNLEEELQNESVQSADKVKKLNDKIRSLQSEKSELLENKEKWETDQELNANMSEKLTKRIFDLQDHIETLKSQLENHKDKVASYDLLQVQLDDVTKEKGMWESSCQRHLAEKEQMEINHVELQERLSESFEKANEQLMLEAGEMATRQRKLLTEMQSLRLKSSIRGVDARIGRALREQLKPVAETCREMIDSIPKTKSEGRGVSPVPALVLGDLAATPRVELLHLPPGLQVALDVRPMSEQEIEDAIRTHVAAVDGWGVEELIEMQGESPRLEGVGRLEDFKRDVDESHVMVATLGCVCQLIEHLWLSGRDSNERIESLTKENRQMSNQLRDHVTDAVDEQLVNLKRQVENLCAEREVTVAELSSSKKENEKISFLLSQSQEEKGALKFDLESAKQVEEELKSQLMEGQAVCDQLVMRMQKVQEEKAELIMAQTASSKDGQSHLFKEEIEKVNNQNAALRAEIEALKKKSDLEIESLQNKVEQLEGSEAVIRKSLDDTQLAGEELIKRVQAIQEEKFELLQSHNLEVANLNDRLFSDQVKLKEEDERNDNLTKQVSALNEEVQVLQQDIERHQKESIRNDDQVWTLKEAVQTLQKENSEYKIRLDKIENEKKCLETENSLKLDEMRILLTEADFRSTQIASKLEKAEHELSLSHTDLADRKTTFQEVENELRQEIIGLRVENDRLALQLENSNTNKDQTEKCEDLTTEAKMAQASNGKQQQTLKTNFNQDNNNNKDSEENAHLKQEIDSTKSKLDALLAERAISLEQLRAVEAENETLKRLLKKLTAPDDKEPHDEHTAPDHQHDLDDARSKFDSLEQRVGDLTSEISDLKSQIAEREERITSINEELRNYKEATIKLAHDVATQCALDSEELAHIKHASSSTTEDIAVQYDEIVSPFTQDQASMGRVASNHNALSREVEELRHRCSTLEVLLTEKEKQSTSSSPAALNKQSSAAAAIHDKTLTHAEASDYSGPDPTTMENLIDFDGDSSVASSAPELRSLSEASECSVALVENLSTTESSHHLLVVDLTPAAAARPELSAVDLSSENRRLEAKMSELETALSNYQDNDVIHQLRGENERLEAQLRIAEESLKAQGTQDELVQCQATVRALRAKLSEAESHIQSGTESDPEVRMQGRIIRQEEDMRSIQRLEAQLQDSDCLVKACKHKLDYEEGLNLNLKAANAKLMEEVRKLKEIVQLPKHPVIETVIFQMKEERLSQSSPASLQKQKSNDRTPRGSISEWETAPFDKVVTFLCDDYAEGKEEIDRLTSELEDSRDLVRSLEGRNRDLEREALDLEEKLQETNQSLMKKNRASEDLQKLLVMNEANSKESIRSKEEDIEKMEGKIQSLGSEVEEKLVKIRELEATRDARSADFATQVSRLERSLSDLENKLGERVTENELNLNRTRHIESELAASKLLLSEKDSELSSLRTEQECSAQEHNASIKSLEDSLLAQRESESKLNETLRMRDGDILALKETIDRMQTSTDQFQETMHIKENSIASLHSQLSDREDRIGKLSARLSALEETETALRSTMDSADDIMAEREELHRAELEELKEGINRSLSEAQRAEMSSEELNEEILLLEKRNLELQEELDNVRKDESEFASHMDAMEMERELMNTSLANSREETEEVRIKNEDLSHVVEDLNQTANQMQATIDELNTQVISLRDECVRLESDLEEKELEISQLLEEKREQEEQNNEKSVEESHLQTPDPVQSRDSELLRLETDLSSLREERGQSQIMIEALRRDKEILEEEITRMQNDIARGSLVWNDMADDNRYDVTCSDVTDGLGSADVSAAKLQDDSLRSENEALRTKIASLEDSIQEMSNNKNTNICNNDDDSARIVPKLELGSIVESEGDRKLRHSSDVGCDDDTGRYVEECDVDTARVVQVVGAGENREETTEEEERGTEERLLASETAAAKLLMQVQEMEEEASALREQVQELTNQNEAMQKEFFGDIHDNFQSQVDVLSSANATLVNVLKKKNEDLDESQAQLKEMENAEDQWRHRYQEVQKLAEELRQQLQRAELDNHDLQCRLIDLDQECQKMIRQDGEQIKENTDGVAMKVGYTNACAQTIPFDDVIKEWKAERRARHQATKGLEDTDNDISDLDSSKSSSTISQITAPLVGTTEADGLAGDALLQRTIIKASVAPQEDKFNEDDIPAPVTGHNGGTVTPDSEPPSVSVATRLGATLGDQIKSLQAEILGYQLMIEKLKKRNKELLEGAGAAMTQDDKEAMEREISALRGQVALLERNNRIFSDRERTDLKQDLELSNKRCGTLQSQLQAIKKNIEYEEMEKLRQQTDALNRETQELREKLQVYQEEEDEDESSSDESGSESGRGRKKYARLLELEEEAEDLKSKIKEQDEDIKDRDVMVDELQHQLDCVKRAHREEAERMEKRNKEREFQLLEEVKDLEKQVEDSQEMIELKQSNLKSKSQQLEDSETEIENLRREIQKKNKEIERLLWDIETLQRENLALRERIDNLKFALSDVNDVPTSPMTPLRSPTGTSFTMRSRPPSRSSTPRMRPQKKEDLHNGSGDSIASPSYVRYTSSIDGDADEKARSPLRDGIKEAKQAVDDMGEVLDTPRHAPVLRSPVPRRAETRSNCSLSDAQEDKEQVVVTDKARSDVSSSSSESGRSSSSRHSKRKSKKASKTIFETPKDQDELQQGFPQEKKSWKDGPKLLSSSAESSTSAAKGREQHIELSNSKQPSISPSKSTSSFNDNGESKIQDNPLKSGHSTPKQIQLAQASFHSTDIDISFGSVSGSELEDGSKKDSDENKEDPITIVSLPSNDPTLNLTIDSTFASAPALARQMKTSSPFRDTSENVTRSSSRTPERQTSSLSSSSESLSDSQANNPSIRTPDEKLVTPEREAALQRKAKANPKEMYSSAQNHKPSSSTSVTPLSSKADMKEPTTDNQILNTTGYASTSSSDSSSSIEVNKTPSFVAKPTSKDGSPAPVKLENRRPTTDDETTHLSRDSSPIKPAETGSQLPVSLLPDDRPTLIQEVAKAREEARKWFAEVTQSDREKRNIDRRLVALEGELERLKGVENNYEELKKKQDDVRRTSRDLETLRTQTQAANRKAEEARQRSALLQAHLLDKEEVEEENEKLKENLLSLKQEQESKNPASPLRELQPSSLTSSHSDVTRASEKKSSPGQSKNVIEPKLDSPISEQLRSIRDSFEFVASNAKVSKLRRKCRERDQLLAKLVLKLRKTKNGDDDVTGDDIDVHGLHDVSLTSSMEGILEKAGSLIRDDLAESDWSESSRVSTKSQRRGKDTENAAFLSPRRPSSALLRALTEKPPQSSLPLPSHRIFVAKRDYAPTLTPGESPGGPITHSLLPDLPLVAGDTVVAIGNPDKRGDGKLYQLAEIRGKIGYVPLAYLVAAEQVEGMQAFVQEKSRKKKSPSSSPEKIVDLYKKLEQAHLIVADKMERASKVSRTSDESKSSAFSLQDIRDASAASLSYHGSESAFSLTTSETGAKAHLANKADARKNRQKKMPKKRPSGTSKSSDASDRDSKRYSKPTTQSGHRADKQSLPRPSRSISPVLPLAAYSDAIRSSTPVSAPGKPPASRRSSSLPPRRGDKPQRSPSDISAPGHFVSPPRQNSQHTSPMNASTSPSRHLMSPPRHLTSPKSPTFLVIEKTMGQKSMIISWTPPVLDMISRSNGVPVIGYEISIDQERRVQVSGAYTNKAILGDLDLTRNLVIEVKTVSSVGTLSCAAEVMFSPTVGIGSPSLSNASRHSPDFSSSYNRTVETPHLIPYSPQTPTFAATNRPSPDFSSPIRSARVLYDYDPAVDSPYKSHEEEVSLNKGSKVIVLGSPRPDGFCDVQAGNRRGLAPVAFLLRENDDDTDSSSVRSSTCHRSQVNRKLRQ